MPDDDPRFEVENATMKAKLREIGAQIDRSINETAEATGKRMGFGLFLFDFGEGGAMFWISNADRQDVGKALREFLDREAQG